MAESQSAINSLFSLGTPSKASCRNTICTASRVWRVLIDESCDSSRLHLAVLFHNVCRTSRLLAHNGLRDIPKKTISKENLLLNFPLDFPLQVHLHNSTAPPSNPILKSIPPTHPLPSQVEISYYEYPRYTTCGPWPACHDCDGSALHAR